MSWQNNDGGDNKNPWGNRPGGGGGQPPNIDEMIKKGQEQLKQAMPGGFAGFGVIALVIVALWMLTGFYRVETDEKGVVLRFGKYQETTMPGLHWHMPFPVETVYTPNVTQERQIDIGLVTTNNNRRRGRQTIGDEDESLMLTVDKNIVDIKFSVVWRIREADKYLFKLKDPAETVADVAKAAMRRVVAKNKIEDIITTARDRIQREVLIGVQEALDLYDSGIDVRRIQISESTPPAQVVESFRDVDRAKSDRERFQNEAESYKNSVIPEANGTASQMVQEAEAYRAQVSARSDGEAARFLSVYNEYAKAKDVTRKRIYLETMEEIMSGMDKIIIQGGKDGNGVVSYLPLDQLKKKGN